MLVAPRNAKLLVDRFRHVLAADGWEDDELRQYARLMELLACKPAPPDPFGMYPRYPDLRERFVEFASDGKASAALLEQAFLDLYSHLHGYEVPYTAEERRRVRETGGYLSHWGGISPILKAGPWIDSSTVLGDFGAGNGLQGLLMQVLYPHRCTVQIEISSRMVEAGRVLERWLGIAAGRVRWIVQDVMEASPAGMDFVYLYRPVRPVGRGRDFYERLGRELGRSRRPVVLFSIADCLGPFLPDDFTLFYGDGHLTCYRRS